MKCLYVSDLHYGLKQFDWLLSIAEQFDIIIIAGDHLDISSSVNASVQIVVILKYLNKLSVKTRLIICSGNHDLNARNAAGEKYAKWLLKAQQSGIHTDGGSLQLDGILFTVCPWWDGPATRAEVAKQLARDAEKTCQRWIWIYHSPPDNSPTSWNGKKHFGDVELSAWIEQYRPHMVLTGHIHQSPFVKGGSWVDQIGASWVFNPGRQMGPCPTHIIFDIAQQCALWFSLEGAEQVDMELPLQRPVAEVTELPTWLK